MDNKKLMQILLRDAGEMEELISGIRKSGSYDALDLEWLQTRASGIRHLLEVAAGMTDTRVETKPFSEKTVVVTTPPEKEKSVAEPVLPEKEPPRAVKSFFRKDKSRKDNAPSEPVAGEKEASEPVAGAVEPPVGLASPEIETPSVAPVIGLEEESVHEGEKQILAEKFVAGKSLNDLLLEKTRNDLKFSGMPLSSLAGAIGTNERFLFTRELFDGNMDSFNDTLHHLDSLNDIREAADFLRENFKWKKSETSLRFIELVKRRYAK